EAEARLKSGATAKRLKELDGEASRAGVRALEFDLALRIAKSKIEEAWYEYDHAVLMGAPTEAAKKHLEDLDKQRSEIDQHLKEAEGKQQQIRKEIDEIRSEVTTLEGQLHAMESERDRLQGKLEGLLIPLGPWRFPRIPKIEQVVLHEFERSNFDTP